MPQKSEKKDTHVYDKSFNSMSDFCAAAGFVLRRFFFESALLRQGAVIDMREKEKSESTHIIFENAQLYDSMFTPA